MSNENEDIKELEKMLGQIEPAVEAIRPILSGKAPEIQSSILAQCLAMWVSGMQVLGDKEATKSLQDFALSRHLKLVVDLLESGAVNPISGRN